MPRRGKGTSPDEALDFVERMTRDWQDLDVLDDADIWIEHVITTIYGDPMHELTPGQESFFQYARDYAIETQQLVGIQAEVFETASGQIRNAYRDATTGRFVSRQTFLETARGRITQL